MVNNKLRLLCWEGYESPSIYEPFTNRHKIDYQAETLLSDTVTAHRLIKGDLHNWDVLNINNAYIRDCLYSKGLIRPLESDRFAYYKDSILPCYSELLPWSYNSDNDLIGIGQRFGPFNLVVNTDSISKATAEDQGFDLANDPSNNMRFGILNYLDFNVFHFCIGAGLNPFTQLDKASLKTFSQLANDWYGRASLVEDDHHLLNQALINRDIDFYISGGIYTASPARLEGHSNIVAISPSRGPINGKGGIVFTEITSVLDHENVSPHAESFLEYILEPETSTRIAFVDGTCNPVAQMGDPKVFNKFSKKQLNAIQWDNLEEDLSNCASYQIPPNNTQLLEILSKEKLKFGW